MYAVYLTSDRFGRKFVGHSSSRAAAELLATEFVKAQPDAATAEVLDQEQMIADLAQRMAA